MILKVCADPAPVGHGADAGGHSQHRGPPGSGRRRRRRETICRPEEARRPGWRRATGALGREGAVLCGICQCSNNDDSCTKSNIRLNSVDKSLL